VQVSPDQTIHLVLVRVVRLSPTHRVLSPPASLFDYATSGFTVHEMVIPEQS